MIEFGFTMIAVFVAYAIGCHNKDSKPSPPEPPRVDYETVVTIPEYEKLSFYSSSFLINPFGQKIPLISVGRAGIVVEVEKHKVGNSTVFPPTNKSTNEDVVWQFGWSTVMRNFPDLRHEIRYLGNKEYKKRHDEKVLLNEEFGIPFTD